MEPTSPVATATDDRAVTLLVLRVAVPLWLAHLDDRREIDPNEEDPADALRRYADHLTVGSEFAPLALDTLARALADFANLPGGAQFAGWIWCAEHDPAGRPAASWEAVCRRCVARYGTLHLGTPEQVARGKAHGRFLNAVREDGRFHFHG